MSRKRAPSTDAKPRCMKTESVANPPTLGLVLAGGLARRMGGGDKARIRSAARPSCNACSPALSRNAAASLSMPTAIPRASPIPDCRWSLTACRISPGRSPAFSPASIGRRRTRPPMSGCLACRAIARSCRTILVARLHQARANADVPLACARSGEWRHPVVGIWPVALREDLRRALVEENLHKIELWTARHGIAIADWPAKPTDPFFNVNTPEDAARAEALAAQLPTN
jgi:molybdopterin-guanine dinucleotide biosynthesis protein A